MKRKFSKGFTLVEVLVCLGKISIVGMIFFTVINISIKSNKKSEIDSNALILAQSEIENIRLQIKNNEKVIKDLDNNEIVIGQLNHFTSNKYDIEILLEEKGELLYQLKVRLKYENNNFTSRYTEIITQIAKDLKVSFYEEE